MGTYHMVFSMWLHLEKLKLEIIAYQDGSQLICATIRPTSNSCQSLLTNLKGRFRQIYGNARILKICHYPSTILEATFQVKLEVWACLRNCTWGTTVVFKVQIFLLSSICEIIESNHYVMQYVYACVLFVLIHKV